MSRFLSVTQALRAIARGELTCAAWVSGCLDRIRQMEPNLHAWVVLNEAGALEEASRADQSRQQGRPLLPAEGAPLGVKDIFNTQDLPTQMGSPLWEGFTPGNDARVVATLRRKGCIVLGKTVTSEFAVHAPGPTVNPHDPSRTPGTSSSGSAAAVAARMVPWALGSQTAGSIIRPASYCGVFGFKPSFGLIPRTGMLKTTDTLDQVGFFTRAAEDLSLMLDQARVSGADYPFVMRHIESSLDRPAPKPWRIGWVRGPKWSHAQGYAQAALEGLVKRLSALEGIHLKEVVLPDLFSRVHEAHQKLYTKSLSYYFKQEMAHPEKVSASFRAMVREGEQVTPQAYQQALAFQTEASQTLEQFFAQEQVDALVTLSTGGEAPVGLAAPDRPDNCLIWTFCGVPALNWPVFTGPESLPFGAQLVARKYDDYPLIRLVNFLAGQMAQEENLAVSGVKSQ